MPIEPVASRFPLPESLRRFFRLDARARVPLAQLAELLGTTNDAVRAMLRQENGGRPGNTVAWTDAATYLFDAWSRAQILDALGAEAARVIPAEFRLTRVQWALPIFVVRAMEYQAAGDARSVDDYIGDVLYSEIRLETVEAFREDEEFVKAFRYPE